MDYEYDRDADILTVRFADAELDHGDQVGSFILHYAADRSLVEIEILDASATVLEILRPLLAKAPAGPKE